MFTNVRRVSMRSYRKMVRQWEKAGSPVVSLLEDGTEVVRFADGRVVVTPPQAEC